MIVELHDLFYQGEWIAEVKKNAVVQTVVVAQVC